MNYIMINGKNSQDINGLLISSLPVVSKPEMRVKTQEVDGRDGDITEFLGYSAYDRTFTIGLYGDYDVDQVINFLNVPDESDIIFSNENEKIYRGYITETIDFEKLLRFRTAQVTAHVQPFKRSAIERDIIIPLNPSENGGSVEIKNNGNIYSRPVIEAVAGSAGLVTLVFGNGSIQVYFEDEGDSITIDPAEFKSFYYDGNLIYNGNRRISGDYDNIRLETGLNRINYGGKLKSINFYNYSRWI